jgi:hypothetical protein
VIEAMTDYLHHNANTRGPIQPAETDAIIIPPEPRWPIFNANPTEIVFGANH